MNGYVPGGGENGPDECVCKTTEAWHGLVCAVLLHSSCACVLALYSGFLTTVFAATHVSRCYRRQTLWWEKPVCKEPFWWQLNVDYKAIVLSGRNWLSFALGWAEGHLGVYDAKGTQWETIQPLWWCMSQLCNSLVPRPCGRKEMVWYQLLV